MPNSPLSLRLAGYAVLLPGAGADECKVARQVAVMSFVAVMFADADTRFDSQLAGA